MSPRFCVLLLTVLELAIAYSFLIDYFNDMKADPTLEELFKEIPLFDN